MLAAYDTQVRTALPRRLPDGVTVDEDGPLQRRSGGTRGFVCYRDLAGLEGDELDALIQRTVAHYQARNEAFEWKTHGHDEPADLPDRLRAARFVPEARETVLVAEARLVATEPLLPTGIVLRAVTEIDDLRRLTAVQADIFGDTHPPQDRADDLARRLAAHPEDLVVLVAEADDEVVSGAWIERNPGTAFAGLWGGATRADWRGRGVYRALVARRAQIAVTMGAEHLQVDASEDSRPILERLGFTAITTTTPYVWAPGRPRGVPT
jgi:GNAT superfamily N-acetyltransferase